VDKQCSNNVVYSGSTCCWDRFVSCWAVCLQQQQREKVVRTNSNTSSKHNTFMLTNRPVSQSSSAQCKLVVYIIQHWLAFAAVLLVFDTSRYDHMCAYDYGI
jgi:hypothetical protein